MSVLSPALLAAVALVLLAAAVGHLRDLPGLRRGLDAHRVLAPGVGRPVAAVLPVLEAVLGATLLAGAAGQLTGADWATPTSRGAGLAAAALTLGFAAYLALVARRSAGEPVPCACGLGDTPVGPSAVLRAGLLAAMAAAGALTVATATGSPGSSGTAAGTPELVVTLAAALTLALGTALLPAARALPTETVAAR